MLRVQVRFPLGVYNAVSVSTPPDAEWPPSPLRLIGALLAAAHGTRRHDLESDRELIQRLCEAQPPLVEAPKAFGVGEHSGVGDALMLRGATRWVSRNYVKSGESLSPRNLARERSEVSKAGVAVGDTALAFIWPDLELPREELEQLRLLAADVAFLGTSRSPAIVTVDNQGSVQGGEAWIPCRETLRSVGAVPVRVPNAATVTAFDRRERWRASSTSRLEGFGMVPAIPTGQTILYRSPGAAISTERDPDWWGEVIVLAVDDQRSELVPKVSASYLFARAVRAALLGAYGEPGSANEAPPALRGRGSEPHCAIVPLPLATGPRPDWQIKGVAFVLPSVRRAPRIYDERERIAWGLARLAGSKVGGARRFVQIPGAGRIWLCEPDPHRAAQRTMRVDLYTGPTRTWRTITPVVHSHWRKERGGRAAQLETDCRHVNLPAPESVKALRGRRGMPSLNQVPEGWRSLLSGPAGHLLITFPEPVRGPVLLGRARHFGLGLCIPADFEGRSPGPRSRSDNRNVSGEPPG